MLLSSRARIESDGPQLVTRRQGPQVLRHCCSRSPSAALALPVQPFLVMAAVAVVSIAHSSQGAGLLGLWYPLPGLLVKRQEA